MALAEIVFLRTQRFTFRNAAALMAGIAGVAILMIRSTEFGNLGSIGKLGGAPIYTSGAVALIIGTLSWSVASALSRKLTLPASNGSRTVMGGLFVLASVVTITTTRAEISPAAHAPEDVK